jgi:hypothetical protein
MTFTPSFYMALQLNEAPARIGKANGPTIPATRSLGSRPCR